MIEVNGWVRVVFMDNEKNDLLQIKSLTEKLDKYDNQKAEINHGDYALKTSCLKCCHLKHVS